MSNLEEERDKMEMIVEGMAAGEIFMREDGVFVDECNDPIFIEDEKNDQD